MKIKELGLSERPRERLIASGSAALSNGELLAIVLRSGTSSMNVLDLARLVLERGGGSLTGLSKLEFDELRSIPGVKESKAAVIVAAIELGRRFAIEKASHDIVSVGRAKDVYEIMIPYLKGLKKEECWALFLNKRSQLFHKERVTSGTSDGVLLDSRGIVREAMRIGARGVIVVHNHPSGNPLPSDADYKHTRALQKMALTCDVDIMDHVIVSDDSFYSFAEDKVFSF